jgi:protein-arginine kinase activator protein McsA
LKEALRNQYHLKSTLEERLAEAVATEQYELAARLRDEMSRKRRPKGAS